jgi:hypothetical protein
VAQPATRGVLVTSVAGFVLGKSSTRRRQRAVEKLSALEAHLAQKLTLPPGYDLVFDADALLLWRPDGSVAAAFGVRHVVVPAEVARAAEEDHRLRGTPAFDPRKNGHPKHQAAG